MHTRVCGFFCVFFLLILLPFGGGLLLHGEVGGLQVRLLHIPVGWGGGDVRTRGRAPREVLVFFVRFIIIIIVRISLVVARPKNLLPSRTEGRAATPRVGAPLSGAGKWIHSQARRINFRAQAREKRFGNVFSPLFGGVFSRFGGVFSRFWGMFSCFGGRFRAVQLFISRVARFFLELFFLFFFVIRPNLVVS